MPLYEYECPECGRFEKIQKFSDPILTACPTCGTGVEKLLSAPAIQFKGTGWYVTDYAGKGKTPDKGKDRETSKSDSGESSKTADSSDASQKSDATPAKSTAASNKVKSSSAGGDSGKSK